MSECGNPPRLSAGEELAARSALRRALFGTELGVHFGRLMKEFDELRKSLAYAMQMHDERTQERNCCIDKLNALNRARKHSGAARAIELLREDAATFSLIEPKDVTDAYYAIAALLEEPETCSNTRPADGRLKGAK